MSALTCGTEADMQFQLSIWGYADAGSRDAAAFASEERILAKGCFGRPVWDDPTRLEGVEIHDETGTHPPPQWHALPWVTEHLIRREAEDARAGHVLDERRREEADV